MIRCFYLEIDIITVITTWTVVIGKQISLVIIHPYSRVGSHNRAKWTNLWLFNSLKLYQCYLYLSGRLKQIFHIYNPKKK